MTTLRRTELGRTQTYKLEIAGMTCTSCAMRVEKKLNKIDGVLASVNYATEKATVEAPETVKKTGYEAKVPGAAGSSRSARL